MTSRHCLENILDQKTREAKVKLHLDIFWVFTRFELPDEEVEFHKRNFLSKSTKRSHFGDEPNAGTACE